MGDTRNSNYNQASSNKPTLAVLLPLSLVAVCATYCYLVALQSHDPLNNPIDWVTNAAWAIKPHNTQFLVSNLATKQKKKKQCAKLQTLINRTVLPCVHEQSPQNPQCAEPSKSKRSARTKCSACKQGSETHPEQETISCAKLPKASKNYSITSNASNSK